jgi:tripartite-type tricarboxylate transporter receptor subunit TctC
VQLIVGWPPGGAADLLARLIGQPLSERLGQPFIIEYRPGVGSNTATEAIVRAPRTLLHVIRAVNGTSADARR